ncbi:Helix-turn-helix [Candidatus Tiddalikarchaeum anstoanum]|nr:Helix-turn-helix [Candidatus Tiddalikarchaeum anstoanum]
MIPDLEIIKFLRRKSGLTQHELSKLSGLSQSYINKIENLNADPPFSVCKKLINLLEKLRSEGEKVNVKSLMTKIKRINMNKTVKDAVILMHDLGVSQLPVTDGVVIVGSFSKRTIPGLIRKGLKCVDELIIKDVMDQPFPMIPEDSPIQLVSNLLEYNEAVLLLNHGIFSGIITKTDLLKIFK